MTTSDTIEFALFLLDAMIPGSVTILTGTILVLLVIFAYSVIRDFCHWCRKEIGIARRR